MLGSTWISSPSEAPITVALYVDTDDPMFVTVLLNMPVMDSLVTLERAKEG